MSDGYCHYTLAEESIVVQMAGALRGVSLDDMHCRAFAYCQAGLPAVTIRDRNLDHRAVAYERIRRERIAT